MSQLHISLSAEKIGTVFGLPLTNSILSTWLVMFILISFSLFATKDIQLIPSRIQSIAEIMIESLYNLFSSVVGMVQIKLFFPLLASIFIFVILANWAGLLPGVGSIGFYKKHAEESPINFVQSETHNNTEKIVTTEEIKETETKPEFIPLFRGATADLNTTLSLALISVISIQYFGVKTLGYRYFKKFINLSNPIMFGVGLLEIVSEFSRIISFAFRLFGNIFAGEVLLTVIAFLMPLFAPLPFIGLELFVGFIQALIFSMLTAVFLNIATLAHEEH